MSRLHLYILGFTAATLLASCSASNRDKKDREAADTTIESPKPTPTTPSETDSDKKKDSRSAQETSSGASEPDSRTSTGTSKRDETRPETRVTGSQTGTSDASTSISSWDETSSQQAASTEFSKKMNELAKKGHALLKKARACVAKNDCEAARPVTSDSFSPPKCPEGKDCIWSEGVGRLEISTNGHSKDVCVASLVAEDVILTAAHCLGQLKTGDQVPEGLFMLPMIRKTADRAAIAASTQSVGRVLLKYKDSRKRIDFAFLHLGSPVTEHRPVFLSREGFEDGKAYSFVGLNRLKNSKDFDKWSEIECFSSFKSFLAPKYDHRFDAYVHLTECPVAQTNSGAPVLDLPNRRLTGVIQGYVDTQLQKEVHLYLTHESRRFMEYTPKEFVFVAGASNVACIPDVLQGEPVVPDACSQVGAEKTLLAVDEEDETLQNVAGPAIEREETEEPSRLVRAFLGLHKYRTTLFRIPKCLSRKQFNGDGPWSQQVSVYSAVINARFEITENLMAATDRAQLQVKAIKGSSSEFKAEIRYNGDKLFTGNISSCH